MALLRRVACESATALAAPCLAAGTEPCIMLGEEPPTLVMRTAIRARLRVIVIVLPKAATVAALALLVSH